MLQVNPVPYQKCREAHKSGSGGGGSSICCCWSSWKRSLQYQKTRRNCSTATTAAASADPDAVEMQVALLRATACLQPQGHQGRGTTEQKGLQQQTREENRYAALEAELLQLLRRSRLQLENLEHKHDTDTTLGTKDHRSGRNGGILPSGECSIKSAASWASLLQNVHTLSMLQQQLQQELKRQQQQQREASAPAAAAAAIAAFIQEMQDRCDGSSKCNSGTKEALVMLLPKKRVYWQQQQQHRQLLLQLVDQVLADLELWAGEAPSDDEAAAPPIPVQAAVAVHPGGRQQLSTEERRRNLPLEEGTKREVFLQRSFKSMGTGVGAGTARAATPPACLDDTHVGEHLLDTASEMKQGALMFRERLQRDNILLQRTAATQEALQQQQRRGLDAAKKLLRFSFFSSLMPLIQLAIALAITLAMVSFILITPG